MIAKGSLIAETPSEYLTVFRELAPRDIVLSPEDYPKLIGSFDKGDSLF